MTTHHPTGRTLGRQPLELTDASSVSIAPTRRSCQRSASLAVDVAVVCGLALTLGCIRIAAPSLWVDEAFTAQAVDDLLLNPLDQYHWLYYAVLAPWTALMGSSEWALRLPSVFASMLACGLLVLLGRRVFGRRIGLVGGLLLATSPFVVMWSQQARGYTLVLASAILATLTLVIALETGTRRMWAAYGLAFSLVFVLQPLSALLVLPAHAVLVSMGRERFLPHGLAAPCVLVVLGLPWAVARAKQTPVENWIDRTSVGDAFAALLHLSGPVGVGLALAVVGLIVLSRWQRYDVTAWLAVWALGPALLAFGASLIRPVFLDRYLIVAAPAFALLGAIALLSVGRRVALVLATALVVATGVGLGQWYSTASNGNWRGEGWRDAVRTVLTRHAETDAELIVVPWWANPAAAYYGASAAGTSTADSIWVLSWSENGHALPAAERRPLGFGEHRLVERIRFGDRLTAQLWRRS